MASTNGPQAHSAPIPIAPGAGHDHHRRRGSSISSDSSNDSPPHTPPSAAQPKISTSPSSPILSYLLSPKSPTGPSAFPGFKRFGGPIMEGEACRSRGQRAKHGADKVRAAQTTRTTSRRL
jgi:hypothetical protein